MKQNNRYDSKENPFSNSQKEVIYIKPGMSGCRLVVLIALGIILASFIGCVASLTLTGAVLKGASDAFKQSTTSHQQTRYSAPVIPNPKMIIQPDNEETTKIIQQMGKEMLENAEHVQQKARQDISLNQPYRSEIIRQNSEKAVMQARTESQSFDTIHKKQAECYEIKNNATRIKCANEYMRARAAFDMGQKNN